MTYARPSFITIQLTPLEGQICLHRIIQDRKLLDVSKETNRTREIIRAVEARIITKLHKIAAIERKRKVAGLIDDYLAKEQNGAYCHKERIMKIVK